MRCVLAILPISRGVGRPCPWPEGTHGPAERAATAIASVEPSVEVPGASERGWDGAGIHRTAEVWSGSVL